MKFVSAAHLTGGGTIGGDLTISGDLTVSGSATNTFDETVVGQVVVGTTLGSASVPSLGFGDANTGFYESADNVLNTSIAGTVRMVLDANSRISLGNNDATGSTSNTIFGYLAGNSLVSGQINNTSIGTDSMLLIGGSSANMNTAVGFEAMQSSGTLGDNVAAENTGIGAQSLKEITTGLRNTCLGSKAGVAITSGSDNVVIGATTGGFLVYVNRLTGIGSSVFGAGGIGGPAEGSTAVGYRALHSLSNGAGNTAVGYQALDECGGGDYNTAVGHQALSGVTGSDNDNHNTAIGYNAGLLVSSGLQNTFVGSEADVDVATDSYQTRIGYSGALRYMTAKITMSDFTTVADDDAATAPLLKIPRYGFLKRVTCTVVTANAAGTGEYNISLGTAVEASGDTVAGRIELMGADDTDDSDFTGATYRSSTFSADGDTQLNIELVKRVHIWEANQATDDSSGWTLMEGQDRYLYVCHANGSNATDSTNAVLRITAEFWGED
jgi:hypothetical protein